MSKLFKLKEWLTIKDAARHLSTVFEEDVTEADILRLGLDNRLKLSVYFVNHAIGCFGTLRPISEARYADFPIDFKAANIAAAQGTEYTGGYSRIPLGLRLNEGEVLILEEPTTLHGVFDLPMIGTERLDAEHEFQLLTGGPGVTLQGLDGPFVANEDGRLCQLQESWEENDYIHGSEAHGRSLEIQIETETTDPDRASEMRAKFKISRKAFKEEQVKKPKSERYYPAGELPDDSVLVVRTSALDNLILKIKSPLRPETARPLGTKERNTLLSIIAALCSAAGYDYQRAAKTAALIQQRADQIGVSLGETTIEQHHKAIPSALESRMK